MTSANDWFKKIKSRAQSVQETAKTRIEKLTETLDKKLKEAQDDLEKQRSKAEASETASPQQQQIWRPSLENPDGEILTVAKPVPIDSLTTLPSPPPPPESPPLSIPSIEPPTIPHTKGRRRVSRKNGTVTSGMVVDLENDPDNEQKRSSTKQRDNHKDIMSCLNDIITEIVDREIIDACLNELIDVISTLDELNQSNTITDISQEGDLTPEQDSMDVNTNESITVEIEVDQESNQQNIDYRSIEHSDDEESDENQQQKELLTLTDSDNTPLQHTFCEDEAPMLENVDDKEIKQEDLKNSRKGTTESVRSTMSNNDEEQIEQSDLNGIQKDDSATSIERIDSEDDDLVNNDETRSDQLDSANSQINTLNDESTVLTIIDQASREHNDSEDERPNIDVTSIDDMNSESNQMDELPILTDSIPSTLESFGSNETHSITSEHTINTPPNELEDSFDEFNTTKVPEHRPTEITLQYSTDFTEFRKFLSNIEDDEDMDEEPFPSKENIKTLDKPVHNLPAQLNSPNTPENSLPLTSSIIEFTQENIPDSPSILPDSPVDELVTMTLDEAEPVEKKIFPLENSHSLPLGIKVSHMNCSSTYIYICTIDRKIFYGKLNPDNLAQPLKWQIHSESAERLVSSISNRAIWRLLDKRLYSSNDPIKFPPIGSQWNEIKLNHRSAFLSLSINDQCGWYITNDGALWLIRTDEETYRPLNVTCPFNLNSVSCFSEKVAVTTSDGEILIRVGCTNDCPEGDGWIFIDHNFGPIDDFVLLTNYNSILIVDKKHRLWLHQWSSDKKFYEVICNDDFSMSHPRYLTCVNSELLCLTDCEKQMRIFSDALIGIQWTIIEKNTRLQRLIGAFSNENYVWALTTDKMIWSSNDHTLEKPRQAQYLTHATFVPNNSSQGTILWSLDESCNIYVRANVEIDTQWEQLNQSQFEWSRRLVDMVCSTTGVWAVDDQGYVYFRHGHISASQTIHSSELSLLPPAWISIPGEARRYRNFAQVFCGPEDWMVYATDNKQNVYARLDINEENRVGTSWKAIEDCSALELAISEHSLWLLTSCGEIQCRENISTINPIGTRSTTLSGHFLSLTVSTDDSQVWALDSKRNLLKLDRFTVLFEK